MKRTRCWLTKTGTSGPSSTSSYSPKAHVGLKDKGTAAYQQAVAAVEAAVPEIEKICGMAKVFQVIRCEREPHITQNLDHFHYHILGSSDPEAHPPTDL